MSMSSEVKCVPTPEPRAHWGGRELPKSPTRTCPLFTLDRYNATAQDAEVSYFYTPIRAKYGNSFSIILI